MSGIEVRKPYQELPVYIVHLVTENSPAKEVDIRKNDQIIEINGKPVYRMSLSEINDILFNKKNPKVNLKIQRNGQIFENGFI